MKNIVSIIKKRPLIIGIFGILSLLYSLMDLYNPVFPLLLNMGSMGQEEANLGVMLVDSLIFIIKLAISPQMFKYGMIIVGASSIGISLLVGVVFSGCFNILNNALEGREKTAGEFMHGVKKYFLKIAWVTFRISILSFIFLIFITIVSVPALFTAKSLVLGKSELSIPAVLLSGITVFVLFFSSMFFRIYMLFWYPAAIHVESDAFRAGKRAADSLFWKIVGSFFAFDSVFCLFQWLMLYLKVRSVKEQGGINMAGVLHFLGNWIFSGLFLAALITYIFITYKKTAVTMKTDTSAA